MPGRVQLAIGLAGVGIGQLALAGVDAGSTWRHFVPGLLVAGVASGVLNAALGREAVASVPAGPGRARQRGQQHRALHRLRRRA